MRMNCGNYNQLQFIQLIAVTNCGNCNELQLIQQIAVIRCGVGAPESWQVRGRHLATDRENRHQFRSERGGPSGVLQIRLTLTDPEQREYFQNNPVVRK